MTAPWTPTERWMVERVEELAGRRLSRPPTVFRDTSRFMSIDRDDVVELDGEYFLVTRTEQECRFGLEGEPKFWVKRARSLTTGRTHILKLVFEEVFTVRVDMDVIRCKRCAEKEALVLAVVRGDARFMQGRAVRDTAGNTVRVVDFIRGVDLLTKLATLDVPHEKYFHEIFPNLLPQAMSAIGAIVLLHDARLCHGDIRNDHILVEEGTGQFRWIDFDLMQAGPAFDVWALGNILHCLVAKGFATFQEVVRDAPACAGRLSADDASVFFPNRIMNLRKVYGYVPARLNEVLLRFSAGAAVRYDSARQILSDVAECVPEIGVAALSGAGDREPCPRA